MNNILNKYPRILTGLWFGLIASLPVMLISLIVPIRAFYMGNLYIFYQVLPVGLSMLFGFLLAPQVIGSDRKLAGQTGALIATLAWLCLIIITSIPNCRGEKCGDGFSWAGTLQRSLIGWFGVSIFILPVLIFLGGLAGKYLNSVAKKKAV